MCAYSCFFTSLFFFLSFHSSSEFVFIQQNVYNGDNVLFFYLFGYCLLVTRTPQLYQHNISNKNAIFVYLSMLLISYLIRWIASHLHLFTKYVSVMTVRSLRTYATHRFNNLWKLILQNVKPFFIIEYNGNRYLFFFFCLLVLFIFFHRFGTLVN